MKFTTDKESLEKVLQLTMRVVNQSATLESLQGVFIHAAENNVYIKSTNLEVGLEVLIPSTDIEDGDILINPKILMDSIKYSTSKNVVLSSTTEEVLNIKMDSGSTNIRLLNTSDFPNIPKQESGDKLNFKIKGFINGIKSVIYAVSNSIIKPELASVYIWRDGDELVFVATDSFRLAEKRIKQEVGDINELSILIPNKNTQDMMSILEQLNEDETVSVILDKDQFSLYTYNIYMTLRTIDGVFPDYRKIIPTNPTTQVTVLKQDLSKAIKKAGVFSDKFNKINLNVDVNDKKVIIKTSNNNIGDTEDVISGVVEGDTSSISINHKYITDCLQSITSDSVVMSFFGQGKPLIITGVGDKSFTYLVMPMNN